MQGRVRCVLNANPITNRMCKRTFRRSKVSRPKQTKIESYRHGWVGQLADNKKRAKLGENLKEVKPRAEVCPGGIKLETRVDMVSINGNSSQAASPEESLSLRDRLLVGPVGSALRFTDSGLDVVLAAGVEAALVVTGRGGLNTPFAAEGLSESLWSFDLQNPSAIGISPKGSNVPLPWVPEVPRSRQPSWAESGWGRLARSLPRPQPELLAAESQESLAPTVMFPETC